MAKFSLPKTIDSSSRSIIRIPKAMSIKIDVAMQEAGYNRKQRSRWIEDVTAAFLQRSDAANLIAEEFIVPGSTEAIPVTITSKLDNQIVDIIERVQREELTRKDRSAVIRTAITQNLLARAGRQLSPKETRTGPAETPEAGHEHQN